MLITKEYTAQLKQLHDENTDFGSMGHVFAPMIARLMNSYKVNEVLDYGCGKCSLLMTMGEERMVDHAFEYTGYDPAVERYSQAPMPAEMVVCLDVLEHVEPQCLPDVLEDLRRCTQKLGFFTITIVAAKKMLSDGRNAHLIVKPPIWWLERIMEHFTVHTYQNNGSGFAVLVGPLFTGITDVI